ncbi:MAG: hypothetical protein JOZ25_05550 [Actinobacteria bacterium]|nr:hypothetical protein [Actinomycetota bacterium]
MGIAAAQNDVVVKGGRYKGFTKQGHYIRFRVDSTGDNIVKLAYKLVESCTNGIPNTNVFSMGSGSAAAIQEDEVTFKGTQHLVPSGNVKSGTVTLKGKFKSGNKATGTIKDKVVFRKSDPHKRGTCKAQSKFTVHLKQ